MKRPRKKYRKREVNRFAHMMSIIGASKLTIDDQVRWAMLIEDTITTIGKGDATATEWSTMFEVINVVEQLVLDGKAQDPHGLVGAAQQACVDIMDRRLKTDSKAVKATELAAFRDLAAAWSELMSTLTHKERDDVDRRVEERVRRALAHRDPNAHIYIPEVK